MNFALGVFKFFLGHSYFVKFAFRVENKLIIAFSNLWFPPKLMFPGRTGGRGLKRESVKIEKLLKGCVYTPFTVG